MDNKQAIPEQVSNDQNTEKASNLQLEKRYFHTFLTTGDGSGFSVLEPSRFYEHPLLVWSKTLLQGIQAPVRSYPPFIPIALHRMIARLETCNVSNWEHLYCGFHAPRIRGLTLLRKLLEMNTSVPDMDRHLETTHPAVIVIAIKLLLCLHTPRLFESIRQELNQNGKVSQRRRFTSSQDSQAVIVHTTCYLMIHLLHCYEYSSDPLKCLMLLSHAFDDVLFETVDKAPAGDVNSVPKGQVGALLMQHSYDYWYERSGCNMAMRRLFGQVTPLEKEYFAKRGVIVKDFLSTTAFAPCFYADFL